MATNCSPTATPGLRQHVCAVLRPPPDAKAPPCNDVHMADGTSDLAALISRCCLQAKAEDVHTSLQARGLKQGVSPCKGSQRRALGQRDVLAG